jgi:hypothetical protein
MEHPSSKSKEADLMGLDACTVNSEGLDRPNSVLHSTLLYYFSVGQFRQGSGWIILPLLPLYIHTYVSSPFPYICCYSCSSILHAQNFIVFCLESPKATDQSLAENLWLHGETCQERAHRYE